MPRALLSVSDKTGLVELARGLRDRDWQILSTGGTAGALREAGIEVTEVSEVTGHPEIMDGRVKTLHPAVHAGLLARRGHQPDELQMAELGYAGIDMLVVNLYPFRETIAAPTVTLDEAIENIDIGGPAMLRSAAKNHPAVWVVVDPSDYDRVLRSLDGEGGGASPLRRELAVKVFDHTSRYDAAIAAYLTHVDAEPAGAESELPSRLAVSLTRARSLRYGENPDQAAAFYTEDGAAHGLPLLQQHHGKALSFNNLLDVDGALMAIAPWSDAADAACVVIKHTTPCGLALGEDAAEAYRKALNTDTLSAFGSVVAFNTPVTEQAAMLLRPNFIEAIVAPGYVPRALEILREKKNIRLLEMPPRAGREELDYKRVRGGFLVQQRMRSTFPEGGWRVVSERAPDEREWADLRFAWRAVASVKSNAILLARDAATLGIGAGQMSRVDSSRIAVMKARDNEHNLAGAVLASDAFFPFRDGVDAAAGAGVRAIIQPGGSVRDEEVIEAADEHGVAMVFTGRRLFRH
jgi:phosphoribosylaminoimidazolecarboxamide formyltransferase/IMP cyclohydrolase